jgi:hypothetical protein
MDVEGRVVIPLLCADTCDKVPLSMTIAEVRCLPPSLDPTRLQPAEDDPLVPGLWRARRVVAGALPFHDGCVTVPAVDGTGLYGKSAA